MRRNLIVLLAFVFAGCGEHRADDIKPLSPLHGSCTEGYARELFALERIAAALEELVRQRAVEGK